jgi:hypothetical protein
MAITRRTLIERIDRFIRSIENRTREPDQWEGHCVKQALLDLNAGDVERAEARIILARTPPQLRTSRIPPAVPPDSRSPTTGELRAEFERLKHDSSQQTSSQLVAVCAASITGIVRLGDER